MLSVRKYKNPRRVEHLTGIFIRNAKLHNGEGGIRTHGTVSRTLVFKTSALNHSATSPKSYINIILSII